MDHPTTLIYLAEAETLAQLHRDWPSELCVALCLEEQGSSDVVFLRGDEVAETPERVAAMLDRDDADFVIVPTFGGYPTKRLSFSQEQQLCGILADMVELPDLARASVSEQVKVDTREDYQVNSGPHATEWHAGPAVPLPQHTPAEPNAMTGIFRKRAAHAPAKYTPIGAETAHWGYVERLKSVWSFTVDGVLADQPCDTDVFAHPVNLSGDKRRLQAVLALKSEGEAGIPAAFQMPIDALPPGCPDLPPGVSHRVFIRAEAPALTITLPIPKAAPRRFAVKSQRRGVFGPAVAAATALVMFQVGTSQEARDIMDAAGAYQSSLQEK